MARPEKEKLVQDLLEKLAQRRVAILTDYTGINVAAITHLRNEFRKNDVEYRVFKNTLARIAANRSGFESLLEFMEGPTGYVFSDDPVTAAKILADFTKANPTMKVKGGLLNGRFIDAAEVQLIASLPPREVLLAQLVGQIQAPISGLVNVLNGPLRKFVYGLEAVRKQKEAA